jgi:hypothetical protein
MEINKGTFDSIFGFDGGAYPEQKLFSDVEEYELGDIDFLFGALQFYDHGIYLSSRTSGELRDKVIFRMYLFVGRLLEQVDLVRLHNGEDISLNEDEFFKVGCMFEDLIGFYEGLEEYEKCAYFLKLRDELFFKIIILQ